MGAGGHDSGKPAVERSVGHYLGARLSEVGAREAFIVPGDFNMKLLDEMMKADPQLHQIGCCNELNAGYAADGYSRATGLGVLVVTHMVGALSALNAVAGAYAEQSAVVCIVGTLNTNDIGGPHIIHHTLANNSTSDQMIAFREFTCHQERIRAAESAAEQIDRAIKAALVNRRPVLIEVPCNLAGAVHASLAPPVPGTLQPQASNQCAIDDYLAMTISVLNDHLHQRTCATTSVTTW